MSTEADQKQKGYVLTLSVDSETPLRVQIDGVEYILLPGQSFRPYVRGRA